MSEEGALYVGRISPRVVGKDLEAMFKKFGSLLRWDFRGSFAFVTLPTRRDAEDAIRALDGMELLGTRLRVEYTNASRRGLDRPRLGLDRPRPGEGRCFRCDREGHWSRECPEKRRDEDRRYASDRHRYSPYTYRPSSRERDRDRDRDRERDRDRDRDRERDRDRDSDKDKEPRHRERTKSRDRESDNQRKDSSSKEDTERDRRKIERRDSKTRREGSTYSSSTSSSSSSSASASSSASSSSSGSRAKQGVDKGSTPPQREKDLDLSSVKKESGIEQGDSASRGNASPLVSPKPLPTLPSATPGRPNTPPGSAGGTFGRKASQGFVRPARPPPNPNETIPPRPPRPANTSSPVGSGIEEGGGGVGAGAPSPSSSNSPSPRRNPPLPPSIRGGAGGSEPAQRLPQRPPVTLSGGSVGRLEGKGVAQEAARREVLDRARKVLEQGQ